MPLVPAYKAAEETARPVEKVSDRSTAFTLAATVLLWPVTIRRREALQLPEDLHGLQSILLQFTVRHVNAADLLIATPEMLHGQPCSLSALAGRLREKGLLRPYQSALRVLERHPGSFTVEMNCMPQAVIYLR